MDIKHVLATNPLRPAYAGRRPRPTPAPRPRPATSGSATPAASCAIGHDGDGFAYDNEGPRHDVLLAPFALRDAAW